MTEYQAMSVGGRFDYRNADQVIRGRDIMLLDWDPSGFILIVAMTDMTDREAEIIRKHKMTVSAFIQVSETLGPTLREKGLTVPAKREYNLIGR